MFVLAGNCRTFLDCVDSLYTHIISKLFSQEYTIHLYLYLKSSDPGPKGQGGWDFQYTDVDYNRLVDTIHTMKTNYPTLHIEYTILPGNEITDNELLSQVRDRTLYTGYYGTNDKLVRGMHCHYNLEKCGMYILEKEKSIQCAFEYIVYVRPDLFFTNSCENIETYSTSIVTLGKGPTHYNNDHLAIVPRPHLVAFFFDRMNVYRNNTVKQFVTPEEVYWHTIPYEVKPIGDYYIKRY